MRKLRVKAARQRTPTLTDKEAKRLPLTENEMPVQEWGQRTKHDPETGTAYDDSVNRGNRAQAAMMERLEKVCWACGVTYNPPLFSSEGKFFCSKRCNDTHVFNDKQQDQLRNNHEKEWQQMAAVGVFDGRQDLRNSSIERW